MLVLAIGRHSVMKRMREKLEAAVKMAMKAASTIFVPRVFMYLQAKKTGLIELPV